MILGDVPTTRRRPASFITRNSCQRVSRRASIGSACITESAKARLPLIRWCSSISSRKRAIDGEVVACGNGFRQFNQKPSVWCRSKASSPEIVHRPSLRSD